LHSTGSGRSIFARWVLNQNPDFRRLNVVNSVVRLSAMSAVDNVGLQPNRSEDQKVISPQG
jgi:hypothetical protein